MITGPQNDKMMRAPVAKKGFHFASDGVHFAAFIEAETIEEAEKIYHSTKQPMAGTAAPSQSTGSAETPEGAGEVE